MAKLDQVFGNDSSDQESVNLKHIHITLAVFIINMDDRLRPAYLLKQHRIFRRVEKKHSRNRELPAELHHLRFLMDLPEGIKHH